MTGTSGGAPSLGNRAIVVGAGMAGLMAACVLSKFFTSVMIIERDTLPSEPALRRGVPQGAHVHTFLGFTVEAMERLIPGVMDELYAAGAVKIRRNLDIWFHDHFGPTETRDVGILTPSVTRPLVEHVVRRQVLTSPNIHLRDATRLLGFEAASTGRVTGVSIRPDDGEQESLDADLVIDASGRASRLPRWLAGQGFGAVPVQELEISMSYTSGLFRATAENRADDKACLMLPIPPATRASYLTPVDGDVWLATMYGRAGDNAPNDYEGFVEWSRGLAHPVIHDWLSRAVLVGKLHTYGIRHATWHRYDRMATFPDGVLMIGEAFTSFNPTFGQGISLAANQALSLQDALASQVAKGSNHKGLSRAYFDGCLALNMTGWTVMETVDLLYPSTKGERPDDLEERWRVNGAIRALAQKDPEILKLAARVTHLLEPPTALRTPAILERALGDKAPT
jgi:2-polyprenyl-6-methoxyphenol hydroxylase-like FAD-dependent oxidoreductase